MIFIHNPSYARRKQKMYLTENNTLSNMKTDAQTFVNIESAKSLIEKLSKESNGNQIFEGLEIDVNS